MADDFDKYFERWAANARRYVHQYGVAGPIVLKRQAVLLVIALIKLCYPQFKTKLARKIEREVMAKFKALGENQGHAFESLAAGGQAGGLGSRRDFRWYMFTSDAVYGVGSDMDLTKANADQLYYVHQMTPRNEEGRIILGRRGRQTFYVWRKILTKASAVKRMIARLKGHIGRLKGGCLPAWQELGASSASFEAIPDWVMKHMAGARGSFENGLSIVNHPEFTIINRAIGARKLRERWATALRQRGNAMATDLKMIASGEKKLGTWALDPMSDLP